MPGIRPKIHVIYGQPDHLSTSYQTGQIMRAARALFAVTERCFANKETGYYVTQAARMWSNAIEPFIYQPKSDFVFYGNDGFVDLRRWKSRGVVYWYDAPWDWSEDPPERSQWLHWLRYQNIKNADYILAVSDIQVKTARRLRPGREDSVHYLPVGVDCNHYSPMGAGKEDVRKDYRIPAGRTIVGYLGYLAQVGSRFAGQIMLEAATGLVERGDLHFLIVGFGPALATFKQLVLEQGLDGYFTFTGYVPPERLPSFIASMDICIDTLEPGFHSEARSETKLKQYMAMGRACVATAIGENCVDLDHGTCGCLVAPGAAALEKGISELADDPDLRMRLGQASRQRALSIYDWRVLAKRMADILTA